MKIAFVVSEFPILSETFILNQITGLLDMGHEVEIFALGRSRGGVIHRNVDKYRLWPRIHYDAARPRLRIIRLIAALWLLFHTLLRHPIKTLKAFCVFVRGYRHLTLLKYLRWVTPFINKNFDIIQSHFGPNGLRCICLREIGVTSRQIITFHGYDVTTYVSRHGRDAYSDLFRLGDLFTYNSEATKAKLLDLGCPPERMVKLPMGIYVEQIDFLERKPLPGNQVNVLSVGRLVEMKGREYAIRAMARIVKEFPNVRYNIAGDGPLRQSLQELIDELEVGHAIKLLGWVDSEQLNELYRTSHVFLHPSVTASDGNMEGQGVVLAEAQAYGMPVVATDHSAFPDSIVDGQSGFLVPEKDVGALVDKLRYLLENQDIWSQMGRCGRAFVENNFDSRILNKRLEQIYRTLL